MRILSKGHYCVEAPARFRARALCLLLADSLRGVAASVNPGGAHGQTAMLGPPSHLVIAFRPVTLPQVLLPRRIVNERTHDPQLSPAGPCSPAPPPPFALGALTAARKTTTERIIRREHGPRRR